MVQRGRVSFALRRRPDLFFFVIQFGYVSILANSSNRVPDAPPKNSTPKGGIFCIEPAEGPVVSRGVFLVFVDGYATIGA